MPRAKRDKRYVTLVKLEVPNGVYASVKEHAARLPGQSARGWMVEAIAAAVKRWKDPVTGKRPGVETWRSGWPKEVPCPLAYCDVGKEHDPRKHGSSLAEALRSLHEETGLFIPRVGETWVWTVGAGIQRLTSPTISVAEPLAAEVDNGVEECQLTPEELAERRAIYQAERLAILARRNAPVGGV